MLLGNGGWQKDSSNVSLKSDMRGKRSYFFCKRLLRVCTHFVSSPCTLRHCGNHCPTGSSSVSGRASFRVYVWEVPNDCVFPWILKVKKLTNSCPLLLNAQFLCNGLVLDKDFDSCHGNWLFNVVLHHFSYVQPHAWRTGTECLVVMCNWKLPRLYSQGNWHVSVFLLTTDHSFT